MSDLKVSLQNNARGVKSTITNSLEPNNSYYSLFTCNLHVFYTPFYKSLCMIFSVPIIVFLLLQNLLSLSDAVCYIIYNLLSFNRSMHAIKIL